MLTFDDGTDPEVALALADGKSLVMNRDGITLDDGKGNSIAIDSTGGSIAIEAATKLTIKAQTIAIEAGVSLDLQATGTLTIQGALVQIN
jgi:phage gp45-like